jgi:hypothetical protein
VFLKACSTRSVFFSSVGVAHSLDHLPHLCNILPCSVKRRWAIGLLRWVSLTWLLRHARQWERQTHAGNSWHGHAELGLLSRERDVQRLLVDLETITVWTNALNMETLAANRSMGALCLVWLWCRARIWMSRSCTLFICAVLL